MHNKVLLALIVIYTYYFNIYMYQKSIKNYYSMHNSKYIYYII
jgi:hypothetical protein